MKHTTPLVTMLVLIQEVFNVLAVIVNENRSFAMGIIQRIHNNIYMAICRIASVHEESPMRNTLKI